MRLLVLLVITSVSGRPQEAADLPSTEAALSPSTDDPFLNLEQNQEDAVAAVADSEPAAAAAVAESTATTDAGDPLGQDLPVDSSAPSGGIPNQETGTEAAPASHEDSTDGELLDAAITERIVEDLPADDPAQNTIIPSQRLPPISLKIVVQPQNKELFTPGQVFGLPCLATSEVDSKIRYSWTRNGRFINLNSERTFLEGQQTGNLIILKPSEDDAGLYQCAAANSEGVVFSRVIQVKNGANRISSTSASGRNASNGRALNTFSGEVFVVLPTSNGKFQPEKIVIVESSAAEGQE